MHRLASSALALATVAGVSGAAPVNDEDWLSLDRELESLALLQDKKEEQKGFEVNGWIKTNYAQSSDIAVAPSGNDLGGFQLQGIRVNFSGKVGAYQLKVSVDGASGGAAGNVSIKDAYARVPLAETVHLQMGNFKSPFLFSSLASDERLVFYERTVQGGVWGGREPGLQIDGSFEQFLWFLAAQNGGDLTGDELLAIAKVAFAAVGKPIQKQEGGYGPGAETAVTLGLSYIDDGSASNATATAFEAVATVGSFFLHGEVVDLDDGFTAVTLGNAGKAGPFADSTPWAGTVEFMANERWGFAARYEDFDNTDDTTQASGGVNWYVNGHATKWQLNFITIDSDNAAVEADRALLGLTVIV